MCQYYGCFSQGKLLKLRTFKNAYVLGMERAKIIFVAKKGSMNAFIGVDLKLRMGGTELGSVMSET